ncbi:MAG: DUF1365 domain-containing protein [Gammaproteobacteria bacterium]|nr:DUF1365 domain-containing protein [Gammaproteobacteria bacterium]
MPPEPGALRSALYRGEVYHRRWAPRPHSLRYGLYYLLLDLDEIGRLDGVSRLFGVDRARPLAFHQADHGDGSRHGLRAWLDGLLAARGLGPGPWQYRLLCLPRVLGYVFNPLTVVWCARPGGDTVAMVYEVNNTFGERHPYVVPVSGAAGRIAQRCDKRLFVSPFFDGAGHYEFAVSAPGDALDLVIDYHAGGARRLHAAFRGRRAAFTAANLRALAWRYPAMTAKVIAGIHYEALKLWLKGVPLHRHQPLDSTSTPRESEV